MIRFEKAVNLKFIARAGSGLENIDVKYAKSKNIHCINAPEGNKQAVAEHALALILSLFNNIIKSNEEIKKVFGSEKKIVVLNYKEKLLVLLDTVILVLH